MADPILNADPSADLFFPLASQPDIVRASQKDEYYKRVLYDKYYEIVQRIMGPAYAVVAPDEIKFFSELCYYGLSTLLGRQTLGEEYCDIMQVTGKNMIPLDFRERLLLITLHIGFPYLYNKLCAKLNKLSRSRFVQSMDEESGMTEERRKKIAVFLPRFKELVETLKRVHVAVFYFTGIFYNISKRSLNVRYIFNRKLDEGRPRYHILGILIFAQLLISAAIYLRNHLIKKKALESESAETSSLSSGPNEYFSGTGKCSLCLEIRTNPTATICGHVFCWNCITEACNNKSECPLCRTPLKKNELTCVYGV
jgi:peroxin-10